MTIDDELWSSHLCRIIKAGLTALENSKTYYDIVNDRRIADLIRSNGASTSHFSFLIEVLSDQELSKCPICGHYNDNIECPIIKCEYCSHEFAIETESSHDVCEECIAYRTGKCNKIPRNPRDI